MGWRSWLGLLGAVLLVIGFSGWIFRKTVHSGKWHLGGAAELLPQAQGFDESLMMGASMYLPPDHPDVVNSKQDFDPIDGSTI